MTQLLFVGLSKNQGGGSNRPGFEGNIIIDEINRLDLRVKYIINTHAHFDHISANSSLKAATGGLICLQERDLPLYRNPSSGMAVAAAGRQPDPDRLVSEGDKLVFGHLQLEVLETPGHTEGGISLLGSDRVFTGDTLFAGSVNHTRSASGNMGSRFIVFVPKLMSARRNNYLSGHGAASTIGREMQSNPF